MKVFLVPPSIGANSSPAPYLTSYVINDTVAVDAGCLGFYGTPQDQARITHLFISHTHMDHVASLPILLENTYNPTPRAITILASDTVLDDLHKDFFNERVWPDFFALSERRPPFLHRQSIVAFESVEVNRLRVTPVPVNHVVPTFGFIIEDSASSIVIVSDTAATDEIWERANRLTNLKAVFLEASFPNSMSRLADISKHLTPAGFAAEVRKLKPHVPVIAVHIKAPFYAEVVAELEALNLPQLQIARYGEAYRF